MKPCNFLCFALACHARDSCREKEMRDGKQNLYALSFWGKTVKNFLLIEMRSKAFCFLLFAALAMRDRLISIGTLVFIACATKVKHKNSHAPHLCLAKAIITDAAEGKQRSSPAPHLYLAKVSHHRCRKNQACPKPSFPSLISIFTGTDPSAPRAGLFDSAR